MAALCMRCSHSNQSGRVCGRCGGPLAQFSQTGESPVARDLAYAGVDQRARSHGRVDLIEGLRDRQQQLGAGTLSLDEFADYVEALAGRLLSGAERFLASEEPAMNEYYGTVQTALGRQLDDAEETAFAALCDRRTGLLEQMASLFEESLDVLWHFVETGDGASLQQGVYLADQAQEAYHSLPEALSEFMSRICLN